MNGYRKKNSKKGGNADQQAKRPVMEKRRDENISHSPSVASRKKGRKVNERERERCRKRKREKEEGKTRNGRGGRERKKIEKQKIYKKLTVNKCWDAWRSVTKTKFKMH